MCRATRRISGLLLVVAACGQPSPQNGAIPSTKAVTTSHKGASYLPLDIGRSWKYEVEVDGAKERGNWKIEGGDLRDGVEYRFSYGTPTGAAHSTGKSIFALPASGPQQSYWDGPRIEYSPPIQLLPKDFELGQSWAWQGKLRWRGVSEASTASVRITGSEKLDWGDQAIDTILVIERHPQRDLTIRRWFAHNVGLVRMQVDEGKTTVARVNALR